jgi:hypothetical protein
MERISGVINATSSSLTTERQTRVCEALFLKSDETRALTRHNKHRFETFNVARVPDSSYTYIVENQWSV